MIIWYIFCFVAGGLITLWRHKRKQKEMQDLMVRSIKGQQLAAALSDPARMNEYVTLLKLVSRERAQEIIINKWKTENHIL